MSFRQWHRHAENAPDIKKRTEHFLCRIIEEFYDFQKDPDTLNNLINHPHYQKQINEFRDSMRKWMVETEDPVLEAFDNKDDIEALKKFMEKQQEWSEQLNVRNKEMKKKFRKR